jgi:hypothetical protein
VSCLRARITVGPGPSHKAIPSQSFCGGFAFETTVRKVEAICLVIRDCPKSSARSSSTTISDPEL